MRLILILNTVIQNYYIKQYLTQSNFKLLFQNQYYRNLTIYRYLIIVLQILLHLLK